jgi:hypothetical protein
MGVGSSAFDVNIGSKHLASNSFSHRASTCVARTDKQKLHSINASTTSDYRAAEKM